MQFDKTPRGLRMPDLRTSEAAAARADRSWDEVEPFAVAHTLPPESIEVGFAGEISLAPGDTDVRPRSARAVFAERVGARPRPERRLPTNPAMGAVLDRHISAGDSGLDSRRNPKAYRRPAPPRRDPVPVPEAECSDQPGVQIKFPTGRHKSLVQGSPRRRSSPGTPAPEPPPAPRRRRRVPVQLILVAVTVSILNIPLFLVVWNYATDYFGPEPEPLTLTQVAELETAIAADPTGGDKLLAKHGLTREAWAELLVTITRDEAHSTELQVVRAR